MKLLKNILFAFAALSLIAACSASDRTVSDNESINYRKVIDDKNKAELHVIEGSLFDLKGAYAQAILEYQEALNYDSSAGIHYAMSKDYFKLGKFSYSLNHSLEAVRLAPDNTEYYYLLATIYTQAKEIDKAVGVYEKIIEIDSTEIQAYFNKAGLIEKDKPLAALEIYKTLLERIGPEWNILIKVADLNERLGNVDETIRTVENLLRINPSNLQLKKLLVESYLKTNQPDKALKLIDDGLRAFPNDLNLIEYKAHAYIKKNEWQSAADEYLKIVYSKDLPSDSKISIGKAFAGQAAVDTTLIPVAKKVITAIDSLYDDWQIKAFLGEIYEQEKNDSLAVKYFSEAGDLASWNSQIWIKLGILLFENQKYSLAAEKLGAVVKNFPDEYIINLILGLSLAQLNNHAEAEPYLAKAVTLNPNDVNALTAYGFTLNQLKKEDEAIETLKKSLAKDPNNTQVLGLLGMIYDGKEMWDECDYYYEKAIAIDSTDALLLNNYAYSLSERGIQLNRSLSMAKKAVAAEPDNSSYLDTIGWIYFKLGEYDSAKKFISQAVEKEPENGVLLDHLGDVEFSMGNKKQAIKLWKDALEKDSSLKKTKQKIETGKL